MAKSKNIRPITDWFVDQYNRLKSDGRMVPQDQLAGILGLKSKSGVNNIIKKTANIQQQAADLFADHFKVQRFSELKSTQGGPISSERLLNIIEDQMNWLRNRVDSDLDVLVAGLSTISTRQSADREVVFEALSKISGLTPDALLMEANKKLSGTVGSSDLHDMKEAAGSNGKK